MEWGGAIENKRAHSQKKFWFIKFSNRLMIIGVVVFLQEIDGKSLLLMKRSDVLTGMSIKLGPALKIHRHVQRLQLAGMSDSGSRT